MMFELLEDRRHLSATLKSGTLTVIGTGKSDSITVHESGSNVVISSGPRDRETFTAAKVKKIVVDAEGGNDHVIVGLDTISPSTTVLGGSGNDKLEGGDEVDFVNGGGGNDSLSAGGGDDILIGGAGDDTLRGGAGADSMHGNGGTNRALTEGDDIVLDSAIDDPANSYVPVELTDLTVTVSVVATGLRPIATVTVANVPTTAKFPRSGPVMWAESFTSSSMSNGAPKTLPPRKRRPKPKHSTSGNMRSALTRSTCFPKHSSRCRRRPLRSRHRSSDLGHRRSY